MGLNFLLVASVGTCQDLCLLIANLFSQEEFRLFELDVSLLKFSSYVYLFFIYLFILDD